ncbi:hypothetical protein ABZ876_08120 [Streptomyces sp. NPDC046931]|uniref:DUF6197 family protein n=1 Tax=Streptomyces sp. NPDC046931 TaxID=3154806 RepID=UPI0033ED33F0
MTSTITVTAIDIADVLDKARAHIVRYGFYRKYLYNANQAAKGMPLNQCEVDLDGAICVAVHGTPLHLGRDPLTQAAADAILARITAPSLVNWCSRKGNGKQQAIALLRDAADRQRRRTA